jgi:transposase
MYSSAVGIDVSSDHLDVYFSKDGKHLNVASTEEALRTLVKTLQAAAPEVIILEASGGYEKQLVARLSASKLPVLIINPRQVRDFAKARGILAKTDKLDAKVLADFALTMQPPLRPLPDRQQQELSDLIDRRSQIQDMLSAERLRLQKRPPAKVAQAIKRHMTWLEKELQNNDDEIDGCIQATDMWQKQDQLHQSVPGIGPVFSRTMIAQCPELGRLSGKAISALLGVAPFCRDSGNFRGERSIWGGRAHLRKVLYMSALVAVRHNNKFKEMYQRLIARGKPAKVALTAVMRKLLVVLNAIVRDQKPWVELKNA